MRTAGRGPLREKTPYTLGNAWIALEASVRRTQIVSDSRRVQIATIGIEDRISLLDQIVRGPCSKRLYGKAGIRRTLGRQDATIADKQIRDVMRATELIDDRCGWITSHPRAADQVSKPRFLHHLLRSCGRHDLHHLALPKLDQLLVVVMQIERDLGNTQAMLILSRPPIPRDYLPTEESHPELLSSPSGCSPS